MSDIKIEEHELEGLVFDCDGTLIVRTTAKDTFFNSIFLYLFNTNIL
jgi:hypothetical protein